MQQSMKKIQNTKKINSPKIKKKIVFKVPKNQIQMKES